MYLGYHGDNKLPAALSHLTPVTHFCSHDFPLLFGSKLQLSEKDAPQPCHGIKKVFKKIDLNQCQFSTLISYHGYELMRKILNTWARLFMTFSVRCHDKWDIANYEQRHSSECRHLRREHFSHPINCLPASNFLSGKICSTNRETSTKYVQITV